jgi:DHA1 family multidrug resistance protein-like MFS transporter
MAAGSKDRAQTRHTGAGAGAGDPAGANAAATAATGADAASPGPLSRGHLAFFVVAVFLLWFGQYIFIPTLPGYLNGRIPSLSLVGVVLSMYGLWQVVVRLPIGMAVDRIGREKPLIVTGFLLSAAGTLFLAFSSRPAGLLVGRSLTGIAMGTWVPLVVVFSRSFAPREAVRASSLLTLVTAAARISSTALNGFLNQWGDDLLAFVVASAAAVIGAAFLLPVPMVRRRTAPTQLGPLLGLIRRRDVMLPSLLAALNQFVVFGVSLGFMPLLASRLGAGDVTVGLMASVNLLLFLGGNMLSAALSRQVRERLLILGTYVLFAGAVAAAAVVRRPAPLFVLQGAMGLAHGIGYPTLMGLSIRDVDLTTRTTAMGIHQSVYSAGIFLGPWACGQLAEGIGLRPMFAVSAVVCLALGCTGAALLAGRITPPRAGDNSPARRRRRRLAG